MRPASDRAAAERCPWIDPKSGERCRRPRGHDGPDEIPHVVLLRGVKIRVIPVRRDAPQREGVPA